MNYQLVSWFPKWKGFEFRHWEGILRYLYDWSVFLGFWEIRKWQTKSIESIKQEEK